MHSREECFVAAEIVKPHGIRGELKVRFDVDDIKDYKKRASFYLLKRGTMTLFHVSSIRIQDAEFAIIQFKEVPDRNMAETLRGAELLVPLSELPERKGEAFYYHDLIGLQVEDKELGKLGEITSFHEMPGQDLLEMSYQNKEVLLPVTKAFILLADFESGILHTHLPEGILDIYLSDSTQLEEDDL